MGPLRGLIRHYEAYIRSFRRSTGAILDPVIQPTYKDYIESVLQRG